MEARQQRFLLAGILRTTEKMLAHAQSGEWQRVEELEQSRRQELERFNIGSGQSHSEDIIEAYASLLFINKQILKLVEAEKQALMVEYRSKKDKNNKIEYYHRS